jgi:hypothetical protein
VAAPTAAARGARTAGWSIYSPPLPRPAGTLPGLAFADEGQELADLTGKSTEELQAQYRRLSFPDDLVRNYAMMGGSAPLSVMDVTDAFLRLPPLGQKAAAGVYWEVIQRRLAVQQPGAKLGHLTVRHVRTGTSSSPIIGRIRPDAQGRPRLQLWERAPEVTSLVVVGVEHEGVTDVLYACASMAEAGAFLGAAERHGLRGNLVVKVTYVPVQPGESLRATVEASGRPVDVPDFDGPVPTMLFDEGFRRDLAKHLNAMERVKAGAAIAPATAPAPHP